MMSNSGRISAGYWLLAADSVKPPPPTIPWCAPRLVQVRRFRNGQLEHVFERRVFGNIWDMRTLPMTSIPTTAWEGGGLHDMQVDGVGTLPRHGPGGRGARRGGPWSGAPQDALLISSDSGEVCARRPSCRHSGLDRLLLTLCSAIARTSSCPNDPPCALARGSECIFL